MLHLCVLLFKVRLKLQPNKIDFFKSHNRSYGLILIFPGSKAPNNLEYLKNTQLCMHQEKPPPAFIWLYIPLLLKSSFPATLHRRPTLCALCKSDQVENRQRSNLWLWKELAAGLWGGLVFNNVSHSDHELMRVFHPVKPNSLQLSHFIKNVPVNLSSTNVFWTNTSDAYINSRSQHVEK